MLSFQAMTPKLTDENYCYLHTQALLVVKTHGLEEHVTGLSLYPKHFLLVKPNNGIGEVNIANNMFSVWKRLDKLLMSWLISLIYGDLFSVVLGGSSITKIWESLETYFIF